MLIYIVRHGETKANVDGYLQGWSDDPLNENGIRLAEITGQNMKGIRFDQCISSPLSRAMETAEIMLRESGNQISIITDDRLREINFGDFERIDKTEPQVRLFFDDPFKCPQFPNGENVMMVMKRTQDFLKQLTKPDNNRKYLVVTHGCALRAMLNYLYNDPADYWHGHVPYNCCINILESKNGTIQMIADDLVLYPNDLIVDRYEADKINNE